MCTITVAAEALANSSKAPVKDAISRPICAMPAGAQCAVGLRALRCIAPARGFVACARAAWEPTWLAMGHALRRLRHFDRSAEAIRTALLLVPGRAASRTALAFTLHCQARSHRHVCSALLLC